jgi:hypothetical protein
MMPPHVVRRRLAACDGGPCSLGLVAGIAAVVGALLVLLRHGLAGLVDRTCPSGCWAFPPS